MTSVAARPSARTTEPKSAGGWFRAVWRWHFYASFLVAPILLLLSVTGLIYLFRFQIEPLLHPELMRVEQPAGMDFSQPPSAQVAAVERAYPEATVVSITEAADVDESARVSILTTAGEPLDVFVNPWGAQVLGALNPDHTVSGRAIALHGELMVGSVGDAVIELGACWALVMAVTGYYLFWKGRRARQRRPFTLRAWHGRIGTVAGIGLIGLLITGLPWTGIWGGQVQQLATAQGSSLWSTDPGAVSDPTSRLDESLPHAHDVPWAAGALPVPKSDPDRHEGSVASVDTAILAAEQEGLAHPMTVALPSEPDGTFGVIGYAFSDPSKEKTVHVDRYGGNVVSAYGFADYPLLAKVVSQGIGLHEGRSLGLWSFWGMTLMCVAIILACLTGPIMWWRRRRSGLDAPRGRLPIRASKPLLALLIVMGVFLPLFGITLLAVLILDWLVVRRVAGVGRFLGAS